MLVVAVGSSGERPVLRRDIVIVGIEKGDMARGRGKQPGVLLGQQQQGDIMPAVERFPGLIWPAKSSVKGTEMAPSSISARSCTSH